MSPEIPTLVMNQWHLVCGYCRRFRHDRARRVVLCSVSPGGEPFGAMAPFGPLYLRQRVPPRARPCAVVHVVTSATTTGPDVDGTPSGERGAGRFRGLVFGGTFGGNKADRREPFRQRSPRRPGPSVSAESNGSSKRNSFMNNPGQAPMGPVRLLHANWRHWNL